MRSVRRPVVLIVGFAFVACVASAGPARADFTETFDGGIGNWFEMDLVAYLGAGDPFSLSVDNTCDAQDPGILGSWSDVDPGLGSNDIAFAFWVGNGNELFANASLRLKLRYSCHPALGCDLWDPVCRNGTAEANNFVFFRNGFLTSQLLNCYGVELHDDGQLRIMKVLHWRFPPSGQLADVRGMKKARVSLDVSRDAWMRAEIVTLLDNSGRPYVRVRARVWQDDTETPGDGTEDEPKTWNAVGDDFMGRDSWEWPGDPNNPPMFPEYTGDPFLSPGSVGIGWNEDAGGSISDMTLDDVSTTAATKGPGILAGDFDGDGDVDLVDFSIFASCFNGPNSPPACP